jgi:alpha-glucosidase
VERVRERILACGIDGTWNDNNEYRIPDDDARCAAGPAGDLRPTLTLLMNHASRSAQRAANPGLRDAQVTRSGGLGTHRYAHTWSGDNYTSWRSLAFNLPMGLSLSLSGWFHHGHDVGGFAGPAPDPELLLRWIEASIAQPRFCIHSWNDDGSATEPWMYPAILPDVQRLLALRTALIPYLQTLAWRAATAGEPFTRPLVYAFPDWRPGWRESFVHLLGEALLVAPVLEPGARERRLLLPPGRWLALASGEVLPGETEVKLVAPLGSPVWLLREGQMLPLVRDCAGEPRQPAWLVGDGSAAAPAIDYLAFPDAEGRAEGSLHWDDGLTRAAVDAAAFDAYRVTLVGERLSWSQPHAGYGAGPSDQRVLVPGGSERVRSFAPVWRPLV